MIADCLQLQVILCGIDGFLPAIVRVFFPAFAVIFACVWCVFLPAILVFLPVSCMYFCLQQQAILHASRGPTCMSSACTITCKLPVEQLPLPSQPMIQFCRKKSKLSISLSEMVEHGIIQ